MQRDRATVSKAGVTTHVTGEGENQQGGRKAEDGEGCREAEFRPVGAGRNQTEGSGIWNSLSKFRKGKLWMSKSSQVVPAFISFAYPRSVIFLRPSRRRLPWESQRQKAAGRNSGKPLALESHGRTDTLSGSPPSVPPHLLSSRSRRRV